MTKKTKLTRAERIERDFPTDIRKISEKDVTKYGKQLEREARDPEFARKQFNARLNEELGIIKPRKGFW